MTRPTDRDAVTNAGGAEDPEVASLVREVASGWTMPPRALDSSTWRERAASRRPGRAGRIAAAAAVAAAAVVVVAAAAALLGGRPTPDGVPSPAASGVAVAPGSPEPAGSPQPGSAGPGATPPAASPAPATAAPATAAPATRAPAATPLPAYLAPNGPVMGLTVGAIAEDGWHVVDMATGALSPTIALPDGSGSRLFALADGTYVCACATFDAPGGRSISMVIRRYDALGRQGEEIAWLGWNGARREMGDGALPVSVDASISADGRTMAVGWTTWDGSSWRSGVDVVDLAPGRQSSGYVLDASVELPARWSAYAGSGRALSVWAPTTWVSPDGRTIVARRSLVTDGAVVRTDWFTGPGVPLPTAEPATSLGGSDDPTHAPCAAGDAADADWTAPDVFSIVCSTERSSSVLRYDASGRDLGDVDLAAETGGGSWPAMEGTAVADVPGGTFYLWEPFTGRLVAVDTMAGRVARSTTIDPGATGDAGPVALLGALAGRILDALVPTAHAKVYLAPAMALGPDGRTIYLLTTSATSFTSGGSGSL
ncbi:MAG: hypothetical protein MUE82_12950, partial [Chloroflexi bacterium]|nr:hypothetical protein [Chloroflexota bacterium]